MSWTEVVIDDTATSAAAAKIALTEARAADPARASAYLLRYDGGRYIVLRRDPA